MKPIFAIPATAALVYRAWSRQSLTPLGIAVAVATAIAHAVHPWSIFFSLLVVFFLSGTAATKVKHDIKLRLTQSSDGTPGGGPRTHVQVIANSIVASILILLHAWNLHEHPAGPHASGGATCWARESDVLVVGIVANYAAVAADTFSSELGILSKSQPRMITAPWRVVPPGTNGGVTSVGLLAGLLGSFVVSLTAVLLLPFCDGTTVFSPNSTWDATSKLAFLISMSLVGLGGSLLDSFLGSLLQASVVDTRTGRVIEGSGGKKVPVHSEGSTHIKQRAKLRSHVVNNGEGKQRVAQTSAVSPSEGAKSRAGVEAGSIVPEDGEHRESRRVNTGYDVLSNNGVNLLMAATMSLVAMGGACWVWDYHPYIEMLS
ncbi:hypothetical protein K490DRAFT_72631 [Saccharata proteae CBS 121410]|uniref:DUF92-domain-containing protein n=1 Tax=Saccharata proteae CBS 121410 TaxID=1314787 RepID=A0A6A5YCA1_9PEZI|nr:hypothetical protein K490DRAFT_72631 [Saccharata proteae CBS 121410]